MSVVNVFCSWNDAVEHLILPAFGEHAEDFDVEAIADEVIESCEGEYTLTVSDEEFWEIAAKHARS